MRLPSLQVNMPSLKRGRRTRRWSDSRSRPAASPRPRCASTAPPSSLAAASCRFRRRRSTTARWSTPTRSPTALRALFAEHKLGKRVRLGIANQRVVVRTLRLPAIEDPAELAAGGSLRRPGADRDAARADDHRPPRRRRRRCRRGRRAADRRDRRRRPPRHDRVLAQAAEGRRPGTGRRRPLGLRHDPRPRRHRRAGRGGRSGCPHRRPPSTATSAT